MNDISVKVDSVSKKYSRGLKEVMLYGVSDVARNVIGTGAPTRELRRGEFWAVKDLSFSLERGRTLGIIGPNGSGKTTTLKMLNGIFMPDSGRIEMKGRVGALIQVGAGFHPMLTGRENVYVNGSILGMSRREIDSKFNEIVEFADIGDFLDAPVRHYSSGMYVRLGFSIAVHCHPDILLVDEVLAVGDSNFYAKCTRKIDQLTKAGTTIVLVSHNMWLIQTMCDEVMVLEEGRTVKRGSAIECIQHYSGRKKVSARNIGSGRSDVRVLSAVIKDQRGGTVEQVHPGRPVTVEFSCDCTVSDLAGYYFMRVTTPDGCPLYTTYSGRVIIPEGRGIVKIEVPSVGLLEGDYRLWVGACADKEEKEVFDSRPVRFLVARSSDRPDPRFGIYDINVRWRLSGEDIK